MWPGIVKLKNRQSTTKVFWSRTIILCYSLNTFRFGVGLKCNLTNPNQAYWRNVPVTTFLQNYITLLLVRFTQLSQWNVQCVAQKVCSVSGAKRLIAFENNIPPTLNLNDSVNKSKCEINSVLWSWNVFYRTRALHPKCNAELQSKFTTSEKPNIWGWFMWRKRQNVV